MSVYKRGGTYWYEFVFNGARTRESAKTTSKTIAREAERARRREFEEAVNHIPRRERTPVFSMAAESWLESKTTLTRFSRLHYRQYVDSLKERFGGRLVCDIDLSDIAALHPSARPRKNQGARSMPSSACCARF
jgi:hypothetical protein